MPEPGTQRFLSFSREHPCTVGVVDEFSEPVASACLGSPRKVRDLVMSWGEASRLGVHAEGEEYTVLETVMSALDDGRGKALGEADAQVLCSLALAFWGIPAHEAQAHSVFDSWAQKLSSVLSGRTDGGSTPEATRLQWCLRKWLEHSLQRERVPTETDEKEIQRHFIGDDGRPTKVFGDLAQDARLMDLMVDRWLLTKRLDLATARHIEFEAAIRPREGRSSLWARLLWHLRHRWTPVVVLVVLALAVICPAVCGYPWLVAPALLPAVVWLVIAFASPHGGRVWAPRLLASVAVGWLALSTTGWAWRLVTAGGSRLQAAVVAAVLLLGSWAYLYHAEVFHHSGLSDLRAWWRAGQILLVGACHAVSLGVVGMAAVAPTILERSCARGWGPLWVWPIPVLLLSAFALALGIIAQTLWERDAVTEPL